MPKISIDYSKCLMYKLVCKDLNIKNLYVGHTTNYNQRKYKHHYNLTKEGKTHYNLYVYRFIRENGGWENWEMIMIEEYPCENLRQALTRERYWLEELKADLNVNIQIRTKEEFKELEKQNSVIRRQQQDKNEVSEYQRKYREENAEKIKENKKEYAINSKDKIKVRSKNYYEENKDEINRKTREYYQQNVDERKIKQKEYNEKNKETIKLQQKERRERNKDEIKRQQKEYREKNKDELDRKNKEYREKNKDEINRKKREMYNLKNNINI